jgi:hypothetical protein
MKRRLLLVLLAAAAVTLALGGGQATSGGGSTLPPLPFGQAILAALPAPIADPTDPPGFFEVKATEFDPAHTNLVQGAWLNAIGCPTDAFVATPNASFTGYSGTAPFTDTACTTGDSKDQHNEGLLLAKTGPSVANFAAAVAELRKVKGITLTELGWDIRKIDNSLDPRGSHCGAGAPRWNITTTTNSYFLGCNSPPATTQMSSTTGWTRMRWNPVVAFCTTCPGFPLGAITGTVERIQIVFDEGQDASGGPDQFGAAILDNIDVNNSLVGHGPTDAD